MNTGIRALGIFAVAMIAALGARAQTVERQDPAAIQAAVHAYLQAQIAELPGKVTFTVGAVDARTMLPACAALDVALAPGARLWGATAVTVHCSHGAAWSIHVAAQVKVFGDYLITARALTQGQVITQADIASMAGELTQLPAGILTDPQQAVGKTVTSSLAASQPLRREVLRAPLAVQQGQTVKLQSMGNGFTVSSEGKALNNAVDGQIAQVRTNSGLTVSGVARAGGIVDVRF